MLPPDAPIAAPRSVRLCRTLLLGFGFVLAVSGAAAQDRQARIPFDIPAQPLSAALYSFSAATGIEVLVDARHAAGRRSAPVTGAMPPHQALAELLAGSRLVPQEFVPGTVTLSVLETTIVPVAGVSAYFVEIQRAVEQTLCQNVRTMPGTYRLALKLWIGPSGEIVRSKRLDTTGDSGLDAALDASIPNVRVGSSPPVDFAQPVALVVTPGYTRENINCPAGAAVRRASHR